MRNRYYQRRICLRLINKNTDQLKAGAGLSYVGMGINYLASIIYTPIVLRLLGQSEYGLYNLVASFVAYLGVLNFGFGSAYMRYYARYRLAQDHKKIAQLNGMFLLIFMVIGIIAAIAGTILAFNADIIFGDKLTINELKIAKVMMQILVINLALSFPNIVFNSNIVANERFIFHKITHIISAIISPFLTLPILLLGYGSIGMVSVTTMVNIMIAIINIVYCFKVLDMKFSFKSFDHHLMKDMTIFSFFIFLYMVVKQINFSVDKYIIGRLISTSEVAIYAIGSQLNNYLIDISAAISFVFIPRINQLVAKNDDDGPINELFIKIGRIQFVFVALTVSGFIIFGKTFITLWAGNDYARSYPVAVVLMIPMILVLIQEIAVEIRKAKDLHKQPAIFMLMIAILNIIITIPLTIKYQAIGSALGTSLTMIINLIYTNIYYQKVVKLDIKRFWDQILSLTKGLIIPIIVGLALFMVKSYFAPWWFLTLAIPYTFIYVISMYRFGLNQEERWLLINDKLRNKMMRK